MSEEEEEKEEEEDEDNDEEKEENDEENEENEKNEEEENKDDDEEGEKEDNKNEEEKDDDNDKRDLSINKFLQSKLKPASEIKIDLKSNEKNNNISNKLNISHHSILTAAFANTPPPITVISSRKQPIQLKSNLQIITDINNDMDLLSTKLDRNIPITTLNEEFQTFKNSYYNNYDKEDYEIKKLINKANEFTNTNNNYTSYKNNLIYNNNKKYISNLNNFNNYKTKYFHTNNNYNESSVDSKDDYNYIHKNFKTLPNLRNDYSEEKNQNYYENNYTNRRMSNRMKNNYTNTSHEDSLYSKDYIIGNDYHHFRNLKRKKMFINNNMTRNFNNIRNINRANTYDNTHKVRNFLNENGINGNKKHLYLKTFDNQTMKKPYIYTQPESYNYHKNFKRKNFSSDNKNYNNYILDRDN